MRSREASAPEPDKLIWPAEGDARAPYWIYTDEALYRRELERIFEGPTPAGLRFREKTRVNDSTLIPGSIVSPI